jgi:hypothetical protein
MLDQIRAHPLFLPDRRLNLLQRASPALVRAQPFPHLVLPQALPEEVYQLLEKSYPAEKLIRSAKHVAQRDQLTAPELLPHPEVAAIWKRFVRVHTSASFFRKLVKFFQPWLNTAYPWLNTALPRPVLSWSCGLRDPQASVRPDVCLDCQPGLNVVTTEPVSFRSAHLDASNKLFTGLFYMKPREDASTGGDFLLYRPRQIPPPFDTPTTIPEQELDLVHTIPYQRNTAVFFLNSPWSIHGVSVREGTPVPRRLVNLVAGCYTLPPPGFFPSPPRAEDFDVTAFSS